MEKAPAWQFVEICLVAARSPTHSSGGSLSLPSQAPDVGQALCWALVWIKDELGLVLLL